MSIQRLDHGMVADGDRSMPAGRQAAAQQKRSRALEIEAEINAVLAERRGWSRAIAHPIVAILVALTLWSPQSARALATLVLLVTVVILLNQLSLYAYGRCDRKGQHARFWRELFHVGIATIGLSWGIGAYLVYAADPGSNNFMVTTLVGITAVGSLAYSASTGACVTFAMGTLTPLCFYAIGTVTGGPIMRADHLVIVPFSVVFGTFVVMYSLSSGRHLRELIERRLDAVEAERRLDHVVRERTRELVERTAELLREKDRAEEASAAKSQFLANVSHELRTPLNAIIGFSEMLSLQILGPIGNDRYREYVGDIHRSGEHLLAIINDLLDLSKIEAGKLDLSLGNIDLQDVIGQCLDFVEESARQKKLSMVTEIKSARRPLVADERAVKQIVTNLLSNAVKFTPDSGCIWLRTHTGLRGETVLTVSDSGIGMSPAEIAKCLEPFGQVDSWLARRYKGTGLGLPIVKALVDLHGGQLSIESRVGEGTRVTATFPAREQVVDEIPPGRGMIETPKGATAPARVAAAGGED